MKKKIVSFAFLALVAFVNCLCMEGVEQQQLSVLFGAIEQGLYNQVDAIVTEHPQIVHVMRGMHSPLMKACIHDKVEIARFLIEKGARHDQHHNDENPVYAMHLVNSVEMLELLHGAGADMNVNTKYNTPALYLFACQRKNDCVQWLLEKGAIVTGDILERIKNTPELKDFERPVLLELFKPHLQPDTCYVCLEEKKWPDITCVKCYHLVLKYAVANHINCFLCQVCYDKIKCTTNLCPMCRKPFQN